MATHSSVLAWRTPGTGEPGGLPSVGLHRVGHDWSDLAAAAAAVFTFTLKALALPFGIEIRSVLRSHRIPHLEVNHLRTIRKKHSVFPGNIHMNCGCGVNLPQFGPVKKMGQCSLQGAKVFEFRQCYSWVSLEKRYFNNVRSRCHGIQSFPWSVTHLLTHLAVHLNDVIFKSS